MIAIIDYGVGNLFSLERSFESIGAEVAVTADPEVICEAEKIVLPGVGAFGDARRKLAQTGMDKLILQEAKKGKPVMGICLGMQLLFEKSYEYGEHEGLGLIKGVVKPIKDAVTPEYKIPHIGWNNLDIKNKDGLFKGIDGSPYVYFVHSYYLDAKDKGIVTSQTNYGTIIDASVQKGNVFATQFHPEKSGEVGLKMLKNFADIVKG